MTAKDNADVNNKGYYLCRMSCFSSGVRTMCSGTSYTAKHKKQITILTKTIVSNYRVGQELDRF